MPDLPLSNGAALHALARRLYGIPRSITGPGVRETLAVLAEQAPIETGGVASGTAVFDWEVPREWVFRGARLLAPDGSLVADAATQNLQVLNFSAGFRGEVAREELLAHLYSLPESPERIPYRTSYYEERWGFCLPHRTVAELPAGDYRVEIDAEHVAGELNWGEALLPGESAETVLFSTHCCHPQLANDNLSGLVVMTALAAELAARPRRRLTYRFLFVPGTIGAIAWLATHEAERAAIRHAVVAAGLGDRGGFHYKRSRRGDAPIDAVVPRALARLGEAVEVEPFVPFGYDERQYNSPGIGIAAGSLTRTPYGRYPEYHTDADDLDLISAGQLEGALAAYRAVVDELEAREVWVNLSPRCEPQLGRRGLYRSLGGDESGREGELAMLWVLNLSDGEHDLATIAGRAGMPLERIREAAARLAEAGLLGRPDS